ncbi:Serine/threonine-protein kinase Nek3 [Saguinus oedipus]|uniref:Serine/threonine-protein kinase Nek3 n=1 Tax=Saguinus oedipus TaxID=9490 RepID=A0ABQ9WBM1_SAGOE|nr:Serine/threonine-protein kinase Nek3 [Saguinus oedipus]
MKHPNIVAFKESFEAEGHLYIVMEYCDGGDLMQQIKQQKGKLFPEDMILNWFTQMCLGVNHIHKKRVLHRDIKSKNIFLTQNGKVKLGDFGSARLLSTYVSLFYRSDSDQNIHFQEYSEPRTSLVRGAKDLGLENWELTSGPWDAFCMNSVPLSIHKNDWKNLILKICQGSIRPLPSHYSYELQFLVKQMFKRNPSHRPSATTLLSRGILAQLVQKCLSPEAGIWGPVRPQEEKQDGKCSRPDLESINENSVESALRRVNRGEKGNKSVHLRKASSPNLHRRQWEKNVPNTALTALENASILTSSVTAVDDRGSEGFLKGPLSEETEASDNVDGGHDSFILDPERLEPGRDEEDTDFEEEDDNPDWVSELKKRAGWQGQCDPESH